MPPAVLDRLYMRLSTPLRSRLEIRLGEVVHQVWIHILLYGVLCVYAKPLTSTRDTFKPALTPDT